MSDLAPAQALPRLFTGVRRRLLVALVLVGIAHAGAAGATVLLLTRGLEARTAGARVVAVLLLALVALTIGWVRSRERLLAERLGQDYVHEIRLQLVGRVLDGSSRRSLGATLIRASNDLTAVRNWVALGIAPAAVGVPMLLGCTALLWMIHPALAAATLVPLLGLSIMLLVSSRTAYEESRKVRRERGRLAGHLADTLTATTAIRSAGGGYRELRRLESRSAKVVEAAVDRARVLGRIRGAAASAAAMATVTVIAGSMAAGLDGATLAAGLTVAGILATPVQDLGRVVEYRQAYRAARVVLAPALASVTTHASGGSVTEAAVEPSERSSSGAAFFGKADLVVEGLRLADRPEVELPALYARAGDRVVVQASDRGRSTAALHALVGVTQPAAGVVRIHGRDLRAVGFRERRKLYGYAAQGMRLERTTIARAVRYREPDAKVPDVGQLLTRVGLTEKVATLPRGEHATLRQGGEPLATPDRALLLLARALYGDPPLLVLDHLDDELGEAGRRRLRDLLTSYPGVVLLASENPSAVMASTRHWVVD
jgi:ABC-type multidrug transport system fused ATPase/permease subunit